MGRIDAYGGVSEQQGDDVYVKKAPGYEQFDENGIPLAMMLLNSL